MGHDCTDNDGDQYTGDHRKAAKILTSGILLLADLFRTGRLENSHGRKGTVEAQRNQAADPRYDEVTDKDVPSLGRERRMQDRVYANALRGYDLNRRNHSKEPG